MRLFRSILLLVLVLIGVHGLEDISMELSERAAEPSELIDAECVVSAKARDGGGRVRRRLAPGKIINNSGVTLTCRPETSPPAIVTVAGGGGTADIDAICPTAGCPGTGACCVLKVVDGCTATVTGAAPPLTVTITCDGIISWCAQKFRGGYVDQWW